jgi:hypothetical protein
LNHTIRQFEHVFRVPGMEAGVLFATYCDYCTRVEADSVGALLSYAITIAVRPT